MIELGFKEEDKFLVLLLEFFENGGALSFLGLLDVKNLVLALQCHRYGEWRVRLWSENLLQAKTAFKCTIFI